MFTEKDGTTIINEDRKKLKKKKFQNLLNFVTFKEPQEKSAFLKIAAQAFEAVDFGYIFVRFFVTFP